MKKVNLVTESLRMSPGSMAKIVCEICRDKFTMVISDQDDGIEYLDHNRNVHTVKLADMSSHLVQRNPFLSVVVLSMTQYYYLIMHGNSGFVASNSTQSNELVLISRIIGS